MNFYQVQHGFYGGIDLHAKNFYVCIVDQSGNKLLHRNFKNAKPDEFFSAIKPWQDRIAVGCESTFNWYWLADQCTDREIPFILGHAQYMRCIHGAKVKNDKIDSEKLAYLLRGGNFPVSYVYPKQLRATRDLMRRRSHYVRRRAEAMAHIRMLNMQYNQPPIEGALAIKKNRQKLTDQLGERFDEPSARLSAEIDLQTIDDHDAKIRQLERHLQQYAKIDDANMYYRLRSIPGVGPTLAMVFMYEIGNINRFRRVGQFLSYARLVRGQHSSAGRKYGNSGHKIGNPHLKWAFSEAALLCKRSCDRARSYAEHIERKHSKARSLTLLANKLGRAIYYMMRRQQAFDPSVFQIK